MKAQSTKAVLLLLAVPIAFTACGPSIEERLQGNWKLVSTRCGSLNSALLSDGISAGATYRITFKNGSLSETLIGASCLQQSTEGSYYVDEEEETLTSEYLNLQFDCTPDSCSVDEFAEVGDSNNCTKNVSFYGSSAYVEFDGENKVILRSDYGFCDEMMTEFGRVEETLIRE